MSHLRVGPPGFPRVAPSQVRQNVKKQKISERAAQFVDASAFPDFTSDAAIQAIQPR